MGALVPPQTVVGNRPEPLHGVIGDKLMRHSEIQLQMIFVEFDEVVGPATVGDKGLPHGSIHRSSSGRGHVDRCL